MNTTRLESLPLQLSTPNNVVRYTTIMTTAVTLSAALEAVGTRPRRAQRRPTKPATYELANHAKAYIEGFQCRSHLHHHIHHLTQHSCKRVRIPPQPVGCWHLHLYACTTVRWFPPTTHANRTRHITRRLQVQDAFGREYQGLGCRSTVPAVHSKHNRGPIISIHKAGLHFPNRAHTKTSKGS